MQTIPITAGGRVTGALIATLAATAATPAAHAAGAVPAGGATALTAVVGRVTDPTDLFTPCLQGSTSVDLTPGDQAVLCAFMHNGSSEDLYFHEFSDASLGLVAPMSSFFVPAGWDFPLPLIVPFTVGTQSQTRRLTWRAEHARSTFDWTVQDTSGPADRIFADGMEAGAPPAQFVDISAIGTDLGALQVGTYVPMPFAFRFSDDLYDGLVTTACITAKGAISFNQDTCFMDGFNDPLATSTVAAYPPFVAPYWDALYAADGIGRVLYATLGQAPARKFVVQWHRMGHEGVLDPSGNELTFQAVFRERDGAIEFNYRTTAFGAGNAAIDRGASATIGLQFDRFRASQFSYATPSLHDGLSIVWTPQFSTLFTATAPPVTINVGRPAISTLPAAAQGLAATLPSGTAGSVPLQIINRGNRTLEWRLGEAASSAHMPAVPAPTALAAGDAPIRRMSRRRDRQATEGGSDTVAGVAIALVDNGDGTRNRRIGSFDPAHPGGGVSAFLDMPITSSSTYVSADFPSNDFGTLRTFSGTFHWFDLLSGAETTNTYTPVLHNVPPGLLPRSSMRALQWDPMTQRSFLSASTLSADGTRCGGTLFSMEFSNPLAPTGVYVGTSDTGTDCIGNIAIDRNGLMYAIGLPDGMLYAIDKTTAQALPIAAIDVDIDAYWPGADLVFDQASGDLYLAAFYLVNNEASPMHLYRVDPIDGTTTPLGIAPAGTFIETFAIAARDGNRCATPASVPWLSYAVPSGSTAPDPEGDDPSTVQVLIDAAGLAPGAYQATLCIANNDPTSRRLAVPVAATVQ